MQLPVLYASVDDLRRGLEIAVGPTAWLEIDQARLDAFAEATEDRQWIHVDPERAKSGPYGATIAHGLLTLSLVPYFVGQLRSLVDVRMTVNYGMNKVRFPTPVPVGARLRGTTTIVDVEALDERSAQVVSRVTIEIDGQAKPACVAETVARVYF